MGGSWVMRWQVGLGVVAAVALQACSEGPKPVLACEGEVSGPIAGPFSRCDFFDQLYRQNTDTFSMTAGYNEVASGLTYELAASLEQRGEPEPGRTPALTCLVTVTSGKKKWIASTGMGAVSGTCQLNFSDVIGYPQQGNTISYCVLKGRITARLEQDPLSPDSLPVDVRLDFNYAPTETDPEKLNAICGVKTP